MTGIQHKAEPLFADHCGHSRCSYVGRLSHDGVVYDLYIEGLNVCLRYGNEGREYVSYSLRDLVQCRTQLCRAINQVI